MPNGLDKDAVPFYSEEDTLLNELSEARKHADELEREVARLEKQLHVSRAAETRLANQLRQLKRLAQTMLCTLRVGENQD
jgi:hypothetical protein